MKRFRKMVPLSKVAENLVKHGREAPLKKLSLMLRVNQALGPRISPHVSDVQLIKDKLRIRVADKNWRQQLEREKAMIFGYLKTALPQIKKVVFFE